ncbi:MotA/TolQ/ExbB proton channel family protein [Pseudoduganella sp. LjRoot289]|uniref:MotA/TolQ/ExbB proton channel family protein n=1 Tax=Pseudoduganella sp. LjRoot289 TaxID=3342314 RepID=UPI003ECED252
MPDLPIDGAVRAIETLLYSISTLLYLPVLLGIAALTLHMLVCLGTFVAEWNERRRGVRVLVDAATAQMQAAAAQQGNPPLEVRLERLVQRTDAAGVRRLDSVRFVVRVGPALGLMGTLIPMGISLAGLAQGNLPKMAESMTTAFTATVVGLACSVTAYVLTLAREHWLRNDLTDVAYAAETLLAGQAGLEAQAVPAAPHLLRSGG